MIGTDRLLGHRDGAAERRERAVALARIEVDEREVRGGQRDIGVVLAVHADPDRARVLEEPPRLRVPDLQECHAETERDGGDGRARRVALCVEDVHRLTRRCKRRFNAVGLEQQCGAIRQRLRDEGVTVPERAAQLALTAQNRRAQQMVRPLPMAAAAADHGLSQPRAAHDDGQGGAVTRGPVTTRACPHR